MRSGRVLIAAVVFLAAGLWVLFNYCQGGAEVGFSSDIAANKVSLNMTTTGVPMLVGLPLAGIGLLLMLIAFIGAIVGQFRRPAEVVRDEARPRREIPFEE
jgi:ABC-type Na+ efflux pump permease subunit